MKAALIDKVEETFDVVSFVFEPAEPIDWQAGQFVYYKLDHPNVDNRGPVRHFTIATSPSEKRIMLTTKFASDRVSSFKQALRSLPLGAQVDIFSVEGKFIIKDPAKKYVFIAGGIGVTPFRSILFDLDDKNSLNEVIFLYFNRNQEIVFKNQLDELAVKNSGLKINYIVGSESFNPDLVGKFVSNFGDFVFYISGSESFVRAIKKNLLKMDVKRNAIKSDYFPGYKEDY